MRYGLLVLGDPSYDQQEADLRSRPSLCNRYGEQAAIDAIPKIACSIPQDCNMVFNGLHHTLGHTAWQDGDIFLASTLYGLWAALHLCGLCAQDVLTTLPCRDRLHLGSPKFSHHFLHLFEGFCQHECINNYLLYGVYTA